jgi:hypothetical protein
MSRGYGAVQREVLAVLKADYPEWTRLEHLVDLVERGGQYSCRYGGPRRSAYQSTLQAVRSLRAAGVVATTRWRPPRSGYTAEGEYMTAHWRLYVRLARD